MNHRKSTRVDTNYKNRSPQQSVADPRYPNQICLQCQDRWNIWLTRRRGRRIKNPKHGKIPKNPSIESFDDSIRLIQTRNLSGAREVMWGMAPERLTGALRWPLATGSR